MCLLTLRSLAPGGTFRRPARGLLMRPQILPPTAVGMKQPGSEPFPPSDTGLGPEVMPPSEGCDP